MKYFAMQRLQALCAEKGVLCVGLDTDPSYLPPEVLRLYDSPAEAVLAFNRAVIESTAPHAVCYKVQAAYYEAMGLAGMRTYAETLRAVRAAGFPVIADVKRGDIADTASAYARAHFSGDFEADLITLNPYMGFDTLEPFLAWAEKEGKGAFTWANGAIYEGDWVQNQREGNGHYKWGNGDEYEGQWKNNTADGEGILKMSDGTVYTGGFVNGREEGKGILVTKDGTRFEGFFKQGEKDGPFVETNAEGKIIRQGTFRNGKLLEEKKP